MSYYTYMISTETDLPHLKEIGHIVALTLQKMQAFARPGISTLELDQFGESILHQWGALSAPRVVYQFPGATCICVNHQTAHGIPSANNILKEGDLINIDVSAVKNGYFSDTGASMVLGDPSPKLSKLLATGQQALLNAMAVAKAGKPIHLIGKAIQATAQSNGFTIIRNLGSHGIGKTLHDEPAFIASYFDAADKRVLQPNQVITIEPFISLGATFAKETGDGWTLATKPKQLTVQFEHTLVVTDDYPIVLTQVMES